MSTRKLLRLFEDYNLDIESLLDEEGNLIKPETQAATIREINAVDLMRLNFTNGAWLVMMPGQSDTVVDYSTGYNNLELALSDYWEEA